MTSREVYHPSMIYFEIDGRQGMLNTKMVARSLDIPLTPPNPIEFQPITQTEATEWQWWTPAKLFMAALFYFEDKVHLKKLQRAKKYPLFFPWMLDTILEYYGFPTELGKERNIIVGKFTLFPDGKEM
ncbi:hypothetical protein CK203_054761 [Vitis vinifera]|uniref:Uncharacterized protein n=1 Tax=Vitis vinifera TaxID=29760 RepID=A0A438GIV1_VITVI|nr:hypothetical protein CK203_054761 [Vitis vinifera]